MLDANLAMDAAKLEFISRIPRGGQLLLNLMREDRRATITDWRTGSGIRKIMTDRSKENAFMASFLYFLGVLTLSELTVKTEFLTLLYNDILNIMDSESEIDRRYADLTMIIRPDMRRFDILDILIDFKFVRLKKAGLTGEEARRLDRDRLRSLPKWRGRSTTQRLN